MRIACWIPEATNTHAVCVITIAFPLQQRLYKRVPILYFYCPVFLADNVLTLSPLLSDYCLRYVCLSTGIRTTARRFMYTEFKSAYCLVRMSSHVLWPRVVAKCCGHVTTRSSFSCPGVSFRRNSMNPGTCGCKPAATVHQTLGTSYR